MQHEEHALDRAYYTTSTRQHELDRTDHTYHTDHTDRRDHTHHTHHTHHTDNTYQKSICREISRSWSRNGWSICVRGAINNCKRGMWLRRKRVAPRAGRRNAPPVYCTYPWSLAGKAQRAAGPVRHGDNGCLYLAGCTSPIRPAAASKRTNHSPTRPITQLAKLIYTTSSIISTIQSVEVTAYVLVTFFCNNPCRLQQ